MADSHNLMLTTFGGNFDLFFQVELISQDILCSDSFVNFRNHCIYAQLVRGSGFCTVVY